jgi:ABC-type lipoprotein release transport system permease subunit
VIFGSLLQLIGINLRRELGSAVFSSLGVALGVGSLVFFVSLGLGVGKVMREKVFPQDQVLVDVAPAAISLGSFGTALNQATIDRLSAMPEVSSVFRKMSVRVPAISRYDGDFFGSPLRMRLEVLALGVDPGLLRDDIQLGSFADPAPSLPIPGVVSSRVLEIYNKSFAPTRNLPQLSSALVVGFTFPIEFNNSMVARSVRGSPIPAQIQVVGVSDRAMLAGVTIPLSTAIRLNRDSGVDAETFSGATLVAKGADLVPTIVAQVKRMGLKIDDQERRIAESVGFAVTLTTAALALLSILICALAAANIAQTLFASVRARAKEIGIMQSVGASRSDVRNIILGEAAAVGLVGGMLGTIGALLVEHVVDRLSLAYLPSFPFKPDTFFSRPWSVLAGGVSLGIVAAVLGAYAPSHQAAATDPAQTLSE